MTVYQAHAQAANTPLRWRIGDKFGALALAGQDKFKQVVKRYNLYEK